MKLIKISNVHSLDIEQLRTISFWNTACKNIVAGIYIYWLDVGSVNYPAGESPMVYIGKTSNLPKRLKHHFTVDMQHRERLVKNEETSRWFYQNYYLNKVPFNITVIDVSSLNLRLEDVETLFVGIFAIMYMAAPICNGQVNRKKFRRLYETIAEKDNFINARIARAIKRFHTKK